MWDKLAINYFFLPHDDYKFNFPCRTAQSLSNRDISDCVSGPSRGFVPRETTPLHLSVSVWRRPQACCSMLRRLFMSSMARGSGLDSASLHNTWVVMAGVVLSSETLGATVHASTDPEQRDACTGNQRVRAERWKRRNWGEECTATRSLRPCSPPTQAPVSA